MALELVTLTGIADALRQWFGALRERRDDRTDREDEALLAVYTALNETKMYLSSQGRHAGMGRPQTRRNRRVEEKLSRLWTAASVRLRHINPTLAERCFLKAGYWADPNGWRDDEVRPVQIDINTVFREARDLL